jgi:SPP1 family predicted phage head-tail adaptor
MSDKQVKAQTSADITIRYIPGITSKDRIKHYESLYEILAVINEDMKNTSLKLICREII